MPKLADHSIPLEKRIKRSKDNYEASRVVKNVSFNTKNNEQAKLYDLTKKFKFSEWVKTILAAFNVFEVKQLIKGEITIPTVLIEEAIENGQFNLEEYLEAKGQKIVDLNEPESFSSKTNPYDQEFNQDYDYSQNIDFNQVNKMH
jgi:hypothetical protein